jgi:hypothetical protein
VTFGNSEVQEALASIASGMASFRTRANLEHRLLRLLQDEGPQSVAALLSSLPGYNFSREGTESHTGGARFVADQANVRLIVTTFIGPASASVNVTTESRDEATARPDPRHEAFYGTWQTLVGLADSEVERLDAVRRAVFLIALLESEVMNGGLGQYLSNTEGAHLSATHTCLLRIGAVRTAALLQAAAELGASAETYSAAWNSESSAFERLDEQFLETGEDLAGLTADSFQLQVRSGSF